MNEFLDCAVRVMGAFFIPIVIMSWGRMRAKDRLLRRCLTDMENLPKKEKDSLLHTMFDIERELGDL